MATLFDMLLERTRNHELLWRPIRSPSQGSAFGLRFGPWEVEIEQRVGPTRDVLIVNDVERGDGPVEHVHVFGDELFLAAAQSWWRVDPKTMELCAALDAACAVTPPRDGVS